MKLLASNSDITYRVELNFGGFLGATEEIEVDAPEGISEDELIELIRTEYSYELEDMLSVSRIDNLGDGDWVVTINFSGYQGVDQEYSVYADYEDDAEEYALEEALWDFSIEYFEPVE